MDPCNVLRLPPPPKSVSHKRRLARTLVRATHSSALAPAPAYGPSLDLDEQHIPSIRYYPTAQVASGEESVSDMEKPMARGSHTDPTQLPPFNHLAGQHCLPRYQLQLSTSSPPANFLDLRHCSVKHNEPVPSAHTQGNLSIDAMNANMGLPHAESILLTGRDGFSTTLPQTQATTQDHHNPTPPQNTNSTLTLPAAERDMRTPAQDATANATFLLKILQLRDLDRIPTLCDLHTTPRIEPSLLDRMTTSLLEMSFSPEIIIMAAALTSRAATLRRLTPIFPHDSAWYSERSTPEATLVIALRVAQLYFTQEPLDGREFYPTLGFYPYDEMASFAKKFGVLVFKAPIALVIEGLGLQTWRALKINFEREMVR